MAINADPNRALKSSPSKIPAKRQANRHEDAVEHHKNAHDFND